MFRILHRKGRGVAAGAGVLGTVGLCALVACSSNPLDATLGESSALKCDDFTTSGKIDANLDANVKTFMEATLDVKNVSVDWRAKVRTACATIATDLDGDDTWTALGDTDDATTKACDAAVARISAVMDAHADAHFALSISRGECHRDFQAQAACEDQCKQDPVCDPGTCETRCEPGSLSVKCEGKCKVSATCEGTVDVAANCMGKCEAECQGECKGTCTWADGHRTENDANCKGKCSASCNGKCKGECKVDADAGVECGANVRCKGGCEGTYTEPTCTTTFTPGPCHVDQTCLDGCVAKAEAHQVCDPTTVTLYADVSVHADVKKLVDTCNANLATLVAAAEVDGKVIVAAAGRLKTSGDAIVNGHASLNQASASCAAAAAKIDVDSSNRVMVATKDSQAVTDTCSSHSE